MDSKYRVTSNVLYNFAGQFVLLALGIITTPFVINNLGNSMYGILSISVALLGYFSILDLGLGVSVVKYISEYKAIDDKKTLQKIIGTAFFTFSLIGLIGAVIIAGITPLLVQNFLKIPVEIVPVAISVFIISAIGFMFNMILAILNSVPIALQRMDLTNTRNIIIGVFNTAGIIAILLLGGGLVEIVLWSTLISVVAGIIFYRLISKLIKPVKITFVFDKEIFKTLIKFGWLKFIGNVNGQIVFQLDKIIIGFFYPISMVAFYAVPVLLVQKGFTLVLNVTGATFPAMTEAQALNDNQRSKELYFRMAKFIVLITFPVMAMFFVFSSAILEIWLGGEFVNQSSDVFKVLAIAYSIAALSAPGVVAADAYGKPQIAAFFSVVSAVINLVAAFILIPKLGIIGAAYALLINFSIQIPIFLFVIHRKLIKISTMEFIKRSLARPILAGLISSVVAALLLNITTNPYLILAIGVPVFGITYLSLNFILGTFDAQDKKSLSFFAGKILKR